MNVIKILLYLHRMWTYSYHVVDTWARDEK